MTPRTIDFKERRDKVLAMTISRYINSVSPVSSAFVAREYPDTLSSATIRNIFSELEEDGYLTHPHTSAGRIPTQKGYRYFVDYLMDEIQLLEEEKQCIKAAYDRESLVLERLLEKTSQAISETTHCTSIISVDGWDNKIFCQGTQFVVEYPDAHELDKIRAILQALDEKKELLDVINQTLVRKIEVFIGHEMDCMDIESCSLVVAQYNLKTGASGRIAVLGPTRMDYQRVVSAVDYFTHLLECEL